MSIIRGSADNYETDAMTVSGHTLVIKITDQGMYYLDVEGPGGRPKISEQRFTSLNEVRKARDAFIQDNIKSIEKLRFIEDMATRPSIKEQRKAERIASTED